MEMIDQVGRQYTALGDDEKVIVWLGESNDKQQVAFNKLSIGSEQALAKLWKHKSLEQKYRALFAYCISDHGYEVGSDHPIREVRKACEAVLMQSHAPEIDEIMQRENLTIDEMMAYVFEKTGMRLGKQMNLTLSELLVLHSNLKLNEYERALIDRGSSFNEARDATRPVRQEATPEQQQAIQEAMNKKEGNGLTEDIVVPEKTSIQEMQEDSNAAAA